MLHSPPPKKQFMQAATGYMSAVCTVNVSNSFSINIMWVMVKDMISPCTEVLSTMIM